MIWPTYGHDLAGQRYSPLNQINTTNVTKLVPAWSFLKKKEGQPFRNSQSIPIIVNGVLYVGFPYNHVAALEPETGKVLREFAGRRATRTTLGSMRSLAYWPGDRQTPPQILFGTEDGELYSINSKTGKPGIRIPGNYSGHSTRCQDRVKWVMNPGSETTGRRYPFSVTWSRKRVA